jgi:hypothetical protein
VTIDDHETLKRFVAEQQEVLAAAANIKFVYLIPKDVPARPNFAEVLTGAITHLRKWMYDATAEKVTFKTEDVAVRKIVTSHTEEWYSTNPSTDDPVSYFWANVATDAFKETGGSFGSTTNITIVYVDAQQNPGQVVGGVQGLAVLPRADIEGLLGQSQETVCRWVGGLGHELGHAVGLDHPPGCDNDQDQKPCKSLMYLGYLTYPDTWLEDFHQKQLEDAPTFGPASLPDPNFDCNSIGTSSHTPR